MVWGKPEFNWHIRSIKKGWCEKQHPLKCFLNQKIAKEMVMKPIAMRKTCQDVGTGSYNPVMRLLADHNFGVWYLFWGGEYGLWNSFWDILCHRNGGVTRRKLLVFETWSLFLLPKRIGYPPTNCITRGWKSQHLWESNSFSPRTILQSQPTHCLDLSALTTWIRIPRIVYIDG